MTIRDEIAVKRGEASRALLVRVRTTAMVGVLVRVRTTAMVGVAALGGTVKREAEQAECSAGVKRKTPARGELTGAGLAWS